MKKKPLTLAIRMDEETMENLRKCAAADQRTMSNMATKILKAYFDAKK